MKVIEEYRRHYFTHTKDKFVKKFNEAVDHARQATQKVRLSYERKARPSVSWLS